MSTYLFVRGLWGSLALVVIASALILLAPAAPDRSGEKVDPIPVPGQGEALYDNYQHPDRATLRPDVGL